MDELDSNKRKLDEDKEIGAKSIRKKRRLHILTSENSAPTTETAKAHHYLRSLETQHGGIFARGSENLAHDSSSTPLERRGENSLSEEDQAHLDTIKKLSKLALNSRKKLTFFQPILAYRESQQPDQGMMQKALDRWKEFSQSSKGNIAWEHLTNNAFWQGMSAYKALTEDKHYENLFKGLALKDKETINNAFDQIQWEDLKTVINEKLPVWKDQYEQEGKKLRNHVVRTTYHLQNLNIYYKMINLNPVYENALKGTLMQFVADAYGKGESRKFFIQAISKILNQQDLKRIRTILAENDLIESSSRASMESQEASTSSGKQQEGSFSEKRSIQKQESILHIDSIDDIDISSIQDAKNSIVSHSAYQVLKQSEASKDANSQNERYKKFKDAINKLNIIKDKIAGSSNKDNAYIQQALESLETLADEDNVIKAACKKIQLLSETNLLQFDNIDNIDKSSLQQAKIHITSINLYRNLKKSEASKDADNQDERYRKFISAIEKFDNIKGKLARETAKEDINIEQQLKDLRKLARNQVIIKTACEKIYLQQKTKLPRLNDLDTIDKASLQRAKDSIRNHDSYQKLHKSEVRKDANSQKERYRKLIAAISKLDNIKGKLAGKPDKKDINIEQEWKDLHKLAKKEKIIQVAWKKICLRQETKLLQFNDVNSIDKSIIQKAREHINRNRSYRELMKSEAHKDANDQDERYRKFISAIEKFDNIRDKIAGEPNKEGINIEQELEALRILAKTSKAIASACKKIISNYNILYIL